MGWPARERASVVVSPRRQPAAQIRGVSAHSLRGATTLEQQTLPAVIVASLTALGMIQLILTW